MLNKIALGTQIIRSDGISGTVISTFGEAPAATQLELAFEDGLRLLVPADLLSLESEGVYRLTMEDGSHVSAQATQMSIPVIEEQMEILKERVERGRVLVHKRVEENEHLVDLAHTTEDVTVERVVINQLLEDGYVPDVRQEGDVLIIPLVEEVQVIETRLMLREEVRVSKRRTTSSSQEQVILRREIVDIERVEPDGTRVPQEIPLLVEEQDMLN